MMLAPVSPVAPTTATRVIVILEVVYLSVKDMMERCCPRASIYMITIDTEADSSDAEYILSGESAIPSRFDAGICMYARPNSNLVGC